MAESAAASNAALLQLLAGLPKTLFGSSTSRTTTGGSVTEQTMFSKEAIDSLLRGILEGTSGGVGLAQIASGQKSPGLYNSTTRNMLVNDYATRAAGAVAEKTAAKVTTKTPMTVTDKVPGVGMQSALMLGALALGSKTGRKKLEDLLKDFGVLGEGGATSGGVIDFADIARGYSPEALTAGFSSGNISFGDGGSVVDAFFAPTSFDMIGAADAASAIDFGSAADAFGNFSTSADWTSGFDLMDGASAATDGFGLAGLGQALQGDFGQAGVQAGMAAIPVIGPVLSGVDALTGGAISEGPGDVVSEGLGFIEDMLGLGGSKVICTELCRQGLMSKHLYIAEATANLKRLSATTLRGYHAIAIPVVNKMRKSQKLSKFLQPWVLDYSNEILYGTGGLRGKFVRYILEPVCFVVGLVVSEQNYKELYANG